VRFVEELGYGSVWIFDHLLAPFESAENRPCFETLTTLGAVALLTARARVGVLVNGVLYRDPVVLAKASAQVDEMTGGRLDFSLGAAWAKREFQAYGMPFPPLAERYERLDEAFRVVKALWAQPRTTFRGRFYEIDDAPCEPKPVQSPHPPITVGGMGVGSLRVAALHADRLNMQGTPEECAATIEKFQKICGESGREFDEVELSHHPRMALRARSEEAEALAERTANHNGENLADIRGNWLIGNPEEVAARVRSYTEVGINHFVIGIGYPFDAESLRLMQEEVLPALD
jgi:alkanesulfonate monooxygenase SsuD/methylene tetrahydromethanopterin reductase-like flavin-dependent oxidoreductase (luciferase family)